MPLIYQNRNVSYKTTHLFSFKCNKQFLVDNDRPNFILSNEKLNLLIRPVSYPEK